MPKLRPRRRPTVRHCTTRLPQERNPYKVAFRAGLSMRRDLGEAYSEVGVARGGGLGGASALRGKSGSRDHGGGSIMLLERELRRESLGAQVRGLGVGSGPRLSTPHSPSSQQS